MPVVMRKTPISSDTYDRIEAMPLPSIAGQMQIIRSSRDILSLGTIMALFMFW